ncbi:MAG: type II toxin-antitoxin system prevent-host-death family antitoxin [Actinobacteria bacterium]|nr:type II toxin-antitoxin system prevent-host-death family antitoxin [Actinomycetota bacterium]
MRQATFTEFRRHAKGFFDAVEAGEVVRVYRNGRPIADVVPIPAEEPAWKRPVERLEVRGASVSEVVVSGRAEDDAKA